nr:polyadenylation factor I complex [Volvox africanus]
MESDTLTLIPSTSTQGRPQTSAGSGVSLDKQLQKAVKTRVLDYVGPYLRLLQACLSANSMRQASHLQPIFACSLDLLTPLAYPQTPASSIGTKFVTSSFFRHRAAINHLVYTPDGRRLLCAGNNGNVSLWNGTNFENELGPGIQAHEASPIRCMVFSHSGLFLLSCDDMGRVKFSKPTLEVLQVYQAHKEPCRSVSFSPTDFKFVTGSDDSTVRVFDTFRGQEQSMTGHGGDVRWVDWHPTKGVIASCSKDACVKLWDPRVGTCLSTLHGHKNGIFQVKWNLNGHWLLSCSRDQLMKLYDVRMLREMNTFSGHGRDVTCVSWHPQHEELFVSGAIDGSLMMWLASRPDAQGVVPAAHDASVWTTAWHPLGHVLASAGADQKCQFWCRKRPGDIWQDVYGHDLVAASTGGVAVASTTTAVGAFSDGAVATLGSGLSPGWAGVSIGSGGATAAAVPGLGLSAVLPGLSGVPTPNRPNVIPGIGAVLDQLSTATLQGLMAAVDTSNAVATGPRVGGSSSCGGGEGVGWAAGPGGQGTGNKRGREECLREAHLRFGERDRMRERDGRGDAWGDRERELGPGKVARIEGLVPRRADGRAGGGMNVGGPPPAGSFSGFVPHVLPGPGVVVAPGPAHELWHGAGASPAYYAAPYEGGYDYGNGRQVVGTGEKAEMLGTALQGRLPPPGERMEWRHMPHTGAPPPRYPCSEDLGVAPYGPYGPSAHEVRGYGHAGRQPPPPPTGQRSVGPGPGRAYSGYSQSSHAGGGGESGYRDVNDAPPAGSFDGYHSAPGSGPDGQHSSGLGPGPGLEKARGRGLPPALHRGGGSSPMYGQGRVRGRGRSQGW